MNLTPWRTNNQPTSKRSDSLASLIDRFFTDPFGERLPEVFQRGTFPALNVAEDAKALTVSLELPGLDEKDIQVNVTGNLLTVSGERKWEEAKKEKEWHRVESQFGAFTRSVTLPTGYRTDAIEAVYSKGILTLTIPKAEPTQQSRITIKSV
jgi:HSP20 family protein